MSPKAARILAWVIFIAVCLAVLGAIVMLFYDGQSGEFGGKIALNRAMWFGGNLKVWFMMAWNGVADFLTITIDTIFGTFTGVDFVAKGIGHYMLIGLIVLGLIAGVFVILFFRD